MDQSFAARETNLRIILNKYRVDVKMPAGNPEQFPEVFITFALCF